MSESRSVSKIVAEVQEALDKPAISPAEPQRLLGELATAIELLERRVKKLEIATDPTGMTF